MSPFLSRPTSSLPLAPPTLCELLRIPPDELHRVDVARMNLLCSCDLAGTLTIDIESMLQELDAWTLEIERVTASETHLLTEHGEVLDHSEPLFRMYCMTRVLWQRFNIHYCTDEIDPSLEADWRAVDRHMLLGLLSENRHGTCSSLPVLLVSIGRRLGYPLYLVHTPGHVFCRWDGSGHENPAWRERRNIEFSGDLDSHEDGYYYDRPVKWTFATIEMERHRKTPLYLRSLSPAEELASFLVQRAHALEAREEFDAALLTYYHAVRFAPHNDTYVYFSKECNRKQVDSVLSPWRITAREYCSIIERRLRGDNVLLPWEVVNDTAGKVGFPLNDPYASKVLHQTHEAVVSRVARSMPILQSPQTTPKTLSPNATDAVFSDNVTELFF